MNLNIHTKLLLIIVIIICCKSISNATGLTSLGTHHTIGLSQKNDCILSLGGRKVNDYKKLNAEAGFVYKNVLTFQSSYQYFSNRPYTAIYKAKLYKEYFNDHFVSIAAGTFYSIPLKKYKWISKWKFIDKLYRNSRHLLFDVFLAYGKGLSKRTIKDYRNINTKDLKSNSTFNFNKFYIQTGISYGGGIGGLSITGLFGVLNIKKIKAKGIIHHELLEFVYLFMDDANYYTYGYNIKIWLGGEKFKLAYNHNQDYVINNTPLKRGLNIDDRRFENYGQLALQVNMNQLFKKR